MYLRGDFIILIPMNKQQILELIKSRRKELGFTQKDMAHKLNIGQTQYSNYELDRNAMSLERLLEIMKLLDLKVEICNEDGKEPSSFTDEIIADLQNCIKKLQASN